MEDKIIAMIEYAHVKQAVEKIELEDYTFFEVYGLGFALVYHEQNGDASPAIYSYPSEKVDGADVILWETVPMEFRRPIILHEVSEFLLRKPTMTCPYFELDTDEVHPKAKEWDERYAREILTDSNFEAYMKYKHLLHSIQYHQHSVDLPNLFFYSFPFS